jgi:hypothetical protein
LKAKQLRALLEITGMPNLFGFLLDVGNYETRKIARDEFSWGFISTAKVFDSRAFAETAVKHPDYNGGKLIVVANYDSSTSAKLGHAAWVKRMTDKELPKKLVDVSQAGVAEFMDAVSDTKQHRVFKREKREAGS